MALWLRLYADVLDNPKIQRLPAPQFKFWINLIALAKLHDGILPTMEDVAFRLRLSGEDTQQHLNALVKAELLDVSEDGSMKPHDWEEHQYDSDSSKERTRKYRDKKKNVTTPSQGSHGDLLEQSRADTEQSRAERKAPIQFPEPKKPLPPPNGMDEFRELMESTGKPLNEKDFAKAAMEAASRDMGDAYLADVVVPYVKENLKKWRDEPNKEFVPFPANLLKNTPWTRTAKARGHPDDDPYSIPKDRLYDPSKHKALMAQIAREAAEDAAAAKGEQHT